MIKLKKIIPFIVAFLVSIVGFFGVILILNLVGAKPTTVFSDAEEQYINFLAYFRTILLGQNNLDYAFSFSVGGGFFSLAAYYLFSPFNLLVVLFPAEKIILGFNIILALKLGAAGITSFIFFRKVLEKIKQRRDFYAIFLGTSFTLSSFTFIFFFHIMWLDGVIMLPLVALGLRKLVEEKQTKLYLVSLATTILANFYVGFMLAIFSVLFVAFLTLRKKREKAEVLEIAKKFFGASILAGGIGMTVIIPTLLSGSGTQRIALSAFKPAANLSLVEFLVALVGGTLPEKNLESGVPNFYVGLIILVLVGAYFLNKKVERREKLAAGGLVLAFVLSFFIRTFNSIWHAGTIEAWFRFRYSYIFAFVLVFIAAESLVLMLKDRKESRIGKRRVAVALAGVVLLQVVDLGGSGLALVRAANEEENGREIAELTEEFRENLEIVEKIKSEDGGFYRIASERGSWNDGLGMNYNGISGFSSTLEPKTREMLTEDLKIAKKINNFTVEYNPGNAEAEKLVGVKYRILKDGTVEKKEDALKIGFLEKGEERTSERVEVERKSSSEIFAKVEAEEGEALVFSIPFNEGWSAEVDGEKVMIQENEVKFLKLNIKPGEHTVKLKYTTRGRTLGAGVGLIFLAISIYYTRKRRT